MQPHPPPHPVPIPTFPTDANQQQYFDFQWRVLTLCSEFYNAADELIVRCHIPFSHDLHSELCPDREVPLRTLSPSVLASRVTTLTP